MIQGPRFELIRAPTSLGLYWYRIECTISLVQSGSKNFHSMIGGKNFFHWLDKNKEVIFATVTVSRHVESLGDVSLTQS